MRNDITDRSDEILVTEMFREPLYATFITVTETYITLIYITKGVKTRLFMMLYSAYYNLSVTFS